MKPPIVISEHGDVTVFASVEKAAQDLEAIDVRNGEYVAYDSEGKLLNLRVCVSQSNWIRREIIELEDAEELPAHQDELKKILSEFLIQIGCCPTEQTSLSDLIKMFSDKQ